MEACIWGYIDVVELLLTHSSMNVNSQDVVRKMEDNNLCCCAM